MTPSSEQKRIARALAGLAVSLVAVAWAAAGSSPASETWSGTAQAHSADGVPAPTSSARLERARRRAVAVLVRRQPRFAVGVDAGAGAVEVQAPALDRPTRAAIEHRLGEVAVRFERAGVDFRRLAACPACYPPYRGGLSLRIGRAGCTSAFTMKRPGDRFVGLTAGHCRVGRGRTVRIGGRRVGRAGKNGFRGHRRVAVDVLRFRIRGSAQRASVYIPALGDDVPVRGRLLNREMRRGTEMCFVGVGSGGGCSVVTRTNLTIKTRHRVQSGLWCIGIPAIPGDSGGPVIHPQAGGAVRAGGIVSGTLFTQSSEEMCYSPISRVARKMNARVLSQRGA